MTEPQRVIDVNEVELCIETFGSPTDPAVLLIMGAAASMDWWPEEFCTRLAGRSRHVVRYDLRDTGQSTSYQPGAPTYTSADLVRDVLGILDTLGIERAHIVGMSMGGGLAQVIATAYADRVASLTLISTSPTGPDAAGLPPMSDQLQRQFSEPPPEPDWHDRQAVIDYMAASTRPFQGSVRIDEASLRDLAGRVFDRTRDMAATNTNHWILDGGGLPDPDPRTIDVPTLVMHGTEDPLFPYPHGEALAAAIPGARLVPLEGVGHGELPPATWDLAVDAIVDVTSTT